MSWYEEDAIVESYPEEKCEKCGHKEEKEEKVEKHCGCTPLKRRVVKECKYVCKIEVFEPPMKVTHCYCPEPKPEPKPKPCPCCCCPEPKPEPKPKPCPCCCDKD